ncbi:sensor histidine kinase [Streptomyces sp. ISL-43]|uniref:sensor histidine kinase n=1 Tax=Streptomyces sp. ISL-43 TaxID=2819183 RepID=UPI001BE63E80|nr:histidine kinase [Streptomyces sp. ISL-43]MBT2450826.1 sensor histidine kinase [Streptomyces sp. ISL-43]
MRIRPSYMDALTAVAQTGVAVLLGREAVQQGWPELDLAGFLLVGLVNVPGAVRTKAPVAVCLFVQLAWFVYVTAGYWPVVNCLGPMLTVYTVAALCPPRTSLACAALMSAIWIYGGLLGHGPGGGSMAAVVAQAVVFPALLWRFGLVARRAADLARQLRLERDERARREVAEERGRIARELHDIVAHHMSVISVQAGLARFVFSSAPATATAALRTIEDTSSEALDELRRMLSLLRAGEPEDRAGGAEATGPGWAGTGDRDAPMPGLSRLAEMAERVRAVGVPVELRVTGEPRALAPGVELCAYRVVQEALTNVLKHARHASVTVELDYRPSHIGVTVTDDGAGGGGGPEGDVAKVPPGGGHGLIGMRERARLYGGTIGIGPRSEGGYAVCLTLPTSARTVPRGDDRPE